MDLPIKIIEVKDKGLGVFASKDITKGEIIESCPVILLTESERDHIANTLLDNYIYPWHDETEDACMVLGYGSLINHSYKSNAVWKQDFENTRMVYSAVENIKMGEEITVNYNGDPNDPEVIKWFEVK